MYCMLSDVITLFFLECSFLQSTNFEIKIFFFLIRNSELEVLRYVLSIPRGLFILEG